MNISLLDPGDREKGIVQIADEMRQDIKEQFPEFKKSEVMVGGGRGAGMGGQSTLDSTPWPRAPLPNLTATFGNGWRTARPQALP